MRVHFAFGLDLEEMVRSLSADDVTHDDIVMKIAIRAVNAIALKNSQGSVSCRLVLYIESGNGIVADVVARTMVSGVGTLSAPFSRSLQLIRKLR